MHGKIPECLRQSFLNKRKLKGKQMSISESLTKMRLMKLKEARHQYTLAYVWTQNGKIMYKNDNKVNYFIINLYNGL